MAVSKVFKICNAYETGVGHGESQTTYIPQIYSEADLNEAYDFGYEHGLDISKKHESHESIVKRIFNSWPEWKRGEHQIRVVEKV